MGGSTVSQFWLPPGFNSRDFVHSLFWHFRDGKIRYIPFAPDAHLPKVPHGTILFEITIPTHRMVEYKPFLVSYAARYGETIVEFPASGFSFSSSR